MTDDDRMLRLELEIEERYNELSALRTKVDPVPWDDYEFVWEGGKTGFGPGDTFVTLWHVLDLVGQWEPADFTNPE